MHLSRLWTDAPVAKIESDGEQQSRGQSKRSRGSTHGPTTTQTEKRWKREDHQRNNRTQGPSGSQRRGRREGRGRQGGGGYTHHIRIATVQLSGV